jgi:putative colanic acid biosynthesis UDP-glucose lipid carrier transferase
MEGRYSKFIGIIHFIGDVVLLNSSFLVAAALRFGNGFELNDHYRQLWIVLNLIWIVVVYITKVYEIARVQSVEKVAVNLFRSNVLMALMASSFIFSLKGYYYSRQQLLFTFAIFSISQFGWRMLMLYLLNRYRQSGYNYRRVIIVGGNSVADQIIDHFNHHTSHGFKLLGIFSDNPKTKNKDQIVGKISEAVEYAKENKVDEIFYTLPLANTEHIRELIEYTDNNLVRLRIIPDFRSFQFKRVDMEFYGSVPVITIRTEPLENLQSQFIKRAFDIVFSVAVILAIYWWLYLIIAIAIKMTSKGPVLFKQLRSGRANESFLCYKFRTMTVNDDSHLKQASKGDARITKVGKFLRSSSLDEMPQFLNVFKGDMSVVGPRPHMLKHTEDYRKIIDKFMVRHLIKPGITGLAQVRGYRGETKDVKEMELRVKSDVWYIENWSFLLDFKLIVLTVVNAIRGEDNAF